MKTVMAFCERTFSGRILAGVVTLFLVLGSVADGATYYVDFATGSDGNDGTSKSSPFMHSPGDDNAAALAAQVVLQPGDTVIFKGGVAYLGTIKLTRNGASGNRITYDGNSAGDWGTGKAIIDLEETRFFSFYPDVGIESIEINNFDISRPKNAFGRVGDLGVFRIKDYCTDWLIKNCIIHHIEDWLDTTPQGSSNGVLPEGCFIYIDTATDIEIDGCEFYAAGRTIIASIGASQISIHDCDFGGIERGSETGYFSVALRISGNSHDIHIYDNAFHDGWQYEGDEEDVLCHAGDWIHTYGSVSSGYPHDLIIERNILYNSREFDYTHGSAFSLVENGSHHFTWRNNLFLNPHAGNGSLYFDNVDWMYIYNNTFVSFDHKFGSGGNCMRTGVNTGNNLFIKNNVFVQLSDHSYRACIYIYNDNWAGVLDNNVYFKKHHLNRTIATKAAGYTLAEWQNAHVHDQNSFFADPIFVNFPSSGMTSGEGNYRLTSLSLEALENGATLSGFLDDYDRVTRPQGLAWEIGAFEYVLEGDPEPPENLRLGN
jgi:hypothetical protein